MRLMLTVWTIERRAANGINSFDLASRVIVNSVFLLQFSVERRVKHVLIYKCQQN